MNIVVFLNAKETFFTLQDHHAKYLRDHLSDHTIHIINNMSSEELRILDEADIYFGWDFSEEWIAHTKKLKLVVVANAGIDHIPVEKLASECIPVISGAGYHGIPMTEQIMMYILGFSRGVFQTFGAQKKTVFWNQEIENSFFDLYGSVMTILGCGIIGCQLAKAAKAFHIHTIGVRRNIPDHNHEVTWCDWEHTENAFAKSTVIVNLLPYTAETKHIINLPLLKKMNGCKLFINAGRGETVKLDDLLTALDNGWIQYCALDVFNPIPPPMNEKLRYHPRVLLTPKTGVYFQKYMDFAMIYFVGIMPAIERIIGDSSGKEEILMKVQCDLSRENLWHIAKSALFDCHTDL